MYGFLLQLVKGLLLLFNGSIKVEGLENLPKDKRYILAAPHHSWLDPIMLAVATYPSRYMFMAKKELFNNKLFAWLIEKLNAFPVDRENPQVSAIKTPVNALRKDELNLIIFPTGSRHSDQIKGGTTAISRLSKRPIVPAVYQGPLSFWELLTRKQTVVRIGKPFVVERQVEGVNDPTAYYNDKLEKAFADLESK